MAFFVEILKAIIYGIVQGITEWLPISSTGHLILVNAIMPLKLFEDPAMNAQFFKMFDVVIQLGSILAVVVLYFNRLNPFSSKKSSKAKKSTWNMWIKILIAAVPAGVVGVLFNDQIDALLQNALTVGIALVVYGVLFLWIENKSRTITTDSIEGMSSKTAFGIGMYQMLALVPGTSRSGSTILGATLLGCSRPTATEFSFFLAIPVMFGASLVKLLKLKMAMGFPGIVVLLVGTIVSFVVSVIVIRSFLKYIRKHSFKMFGTYRIILGVVVLILLAFGVIPNAIA